ncbi:bifunctional diguanylate cyclase/phosphodiesterase [Marinomonas sp.]|nr:bifunctional diguanylate cyclase/phosphodiesterase [Marinomonas sp.]MDB4836918.1 bifunctional diguanylate cyclase/phosphodiesterase [Marinomonas sp.]
MILNNTLKPFAALSFVTLLAAFLHISGVLDTERSLYGGTNDAIIDSFLVGDVTGTFVEEDGHSIMTCELGNIQTFHLCGIALQLAEQDKTSGINVSTYETIELELNYKAPVDNAKIKVTLRNHHENYSTLSDPTSQKFNTVSFDTSKFTGPIIVPLDAFQVENWWIDQYQVDFKDSLMDISNVVHLEFITHGMPVAGEYEISLKSVTLRGVIISEYNLFKAIFGLWIVVGLIMLLRQHYQLREISKKDALTGLYNNLGIHQEIQSIPSTNTVYMFHICLNELKEINDIYGHDIGDNTLIHSSNIIKDKISRFAEKSYLCRFSGDEFVIVFDNLAEEEVQSLAHSMVSGGQYAIPIPLHNIFISMSLGVAKTQDIVNKFDTLIAHSSAAMHHAKNNQLPSFQEFDETFSQNIYFEKLVSQFIKEALFKGEFHLNYMPIYDTKLLKASAFEVLLRTTSENMKGIGPDVFIPVAEKFNLIKEIDTWVIENTFKNIEKNYSFLKENPVKFCINISSEQLKNPPFVKQLKGLLTEYCIPPEWIELELTETSLVKTEQESIDILHGIRALGVDLSLDDYGTGYISFNQLVNYPVNNLKIDKSFVDLLETDDDQAAMIIQAIQSLATSYKLTTVAEGVETPKQYDYLSKLGCDFIQGYVFSKPLPWPLAKERIISPATETERLKNRLAQ